MKKAKKIICNVRCAFDETHVFEAAFLIKEGSEDIKTRVEKFCPFCDKMVTVAVQGEVLPDRELLRKFNL